MKAMPKPSGKFFKPVGGYVSHLQAGGRWYYVPGSFMDEARKGTTEAHAIVDRYYAECNRLGIKIQRVPQFPALSQRITKHGMNLKAMTDFPEWRW